MSVKLYTHTISDRRRSLLLPPLLADKRQRLTRLIFVTPGYRLIPETTAHSCVDDSVDAYNWVHSSLAQGLNIELALAPVYHSAGLSNGSHDDEWLAAKNWKLMSAENLTSDLQGASPGHAQELT